MVAEKTIRKGYKAFLAYVQYAGTVDPSVDSIHMVREFSDVFLEELLGLPPDLKVEFSIELLSGTTPTSIVPYRVEPKKLTELKV